MDHRARHVSWIGSAKKLYVMLIVVSGCVNLAMAQRTQEPSSPELRAIGFLSREVPRWSKENQCYSCHNNGDAARALYTAIGLSYKVDDQAVGDTSRWLVRPDGWKDNGGDEQSSDKRLASIQFAFSLLTANQSGVVDDKSALRRAAEIVVTHQAADGSWRIDVSRSLGSPVTYGQVLATVVARRVLFGADAQYFKRQIALADRWLDGQRPRTVFDSAAWLIGWSDRADGTADRRDHFLDIIRKGQTKEGGWGPYELSAPEPFDTAIVLLALTKLDPTPGIRQMIEQGREFLIETQLDDGGWQETTRPAQRESYAQHISTTGWATLALLASESLDGAAPVSGEKP